MAYLRYHTVRNVLLGAVIGGGITAGVIFATTGGSDPSPSPTPAPAAAPTQHMPSAPSPTPARTAATTPTVSSDEPYAEQLATVAGVIVSQRATSEKIKDYFRGKGPKVNIYDDDRDGQWDRAKVDYDRDEVDDEKLTFKAGTLERKTEKTGKVRVWDNGSWRDK